jgi:hypothetical protein
MTLFAAACKRREKEDTGYKSRGLYILLGPKTIFPPSLPLRKNRLIFPLLWCVCCCSPLTFFVFIFVHFTLISPFDFSFFFFLFFPFLHFLPFYLPRLHNFPVRLQRLIFFLPQMGWGRIFQICKDEGFFRSWALGDIMMPDWNRWHICFVWQCQKKKYPKLGYGTRSSYSSALKSTYRYMPV